MRAGCGRPKGEEGGSTHVCTADTAAPGRPPAQHPPPPSGWRTMISIDTGHTNEVGMGLPSRLCTLACRRGKRRQLAAAGRAGGGGDAAAGGRVRPPGGLPGSSTAAT